MYYKCNTISEVTTYARCHAWNLMYEAAVYCSYLHKQFEVVQIGDACWFVEDVYDSSNEC